MNQQIFEKLLACPKCKNPIKVNKTLGKCLLCNKTYRKQGGIWNLLHLISAVTKTSQKKYDKLFNNKFSGPKDGSYEILSSFVKGNQAIDIACGTGLIEKLSPQTVGLDFSLSALKVAKKNGAKYLILADAHALPFKDNAFHIALSSGNLEHFINPQLAINETARISKIQIFLVHKYPPLPFISHIYHFLFKFFNIKMQPIEKPMTKNHLKKLIKNAHLHIVFDGVWTLPINYGRVVKFLPEFTNMPSAHFIISIKNQINE